MCCDILDWLSNTSVLIITIQESYQQIKHAHVSFTIIPSNSYHHTIQLLSLSSSIIIQSSMQTTAYLYPSLLHYHIITHQYPQYHRVIIWQYHCIMSLHVSLESIARVCYYWIDYYIRIPLSSVVAAHACASADSQVWRVGVDSSH